ncbi:MAG: DUF1998 domain-containing protein [Caldilineaceae bacterium]|nr:DUF1998 domain-containing protein [Caldilineaceae bacterium]
MSERPDAAKVGELRPSQLMYTYGIGAIVDLPYLSAIVMGIDDWEVDPSVSPPITEERLLRAVRSQLGSQVRDLKTPPSAPDTFSVPGPFSKQARTGVPVATFPRWVLCPACQRLASLSSGQFKLDPNWSRPEYTRYVHVNCEKVAKPPPVVPARFLVACANGHLDDFPWVDFVHAGAPCNTPLLRLIEFGPSGEARELMVQCDTCKKSRRMSVAFGDQGRVTMPMCRGRRPHLRDFENEPCDQQVRAMLLGASNLWFPEVYSTLAIPAQDLRIDQLVEDSWATLQNVANLQNVELLRSIGQLGDFVGYENEQVWEAIERRRNRADDSELATPTDLKTPEWQIFSKPSIVTPSADLQLKPVTVPEGLDKFLDRVVIVERLREVRAVVGFTRIDSPGDLEDGQPEAGGIRAPISRQAPTWVPASDIRGEGIFIQFREDALQAWLDQDVCRRLNSEFYESHRRWREVRHIEPNEEGYPGLRYVLLHSFSHALMRRLTLECGYNAASVRERIYSRNPNQNSDQPEPMAGVLIYTAAPDSEGTLGGLAALGEPVQLGRHIQAALTDARICASDPLCAEHAPSRRGMTLHAAACHACLFAPETSCERGNRYLDRSVLAKTVDEVERSFFNGIG